MTRRFRFFLAAALVAAAVLPAAAEMKIGATPMTSATGLSVSPPVGSVLPWYKSLKGVPAALPEGWVELNGQVVEDASSPLYKTRLPDLNRVSRSLLQGATATVAQAEKLRAEAAARAAAKTEAAGEKPAAEAKPEAAPAKSAKDAGPNPFDVIFIVRIK